MSVMTHEHDDSWGGRDHFLSPVSSIAHLTPPPLDPAPIPPPPVSSTARRSSYRACIASSASLAAAHSASRRSLDSLSMLACTAWCVCGGWGGGGKITHSASRRSLDSLSMLTCNAWCVRVCVWGVCVGGGRSLDSPGAYMLIHSLTGGRGTFLCVCMCVHTCVLNLTVQPNGRPTAIPVTHVYVQAVFRVN